ncbi:hypothetical protein RclHR1_11430004 [Rhizophagus clarus]|uniref:Arrestin domain-containing protein 3-like n=1 Tax=Rhizophagus clarus TaxID=94130 RepID=A0A2Z6QX85_9GLOM|nr:hypothetical protein RclHR1_11430004 [Rhizophagus clarus]GES80371.1 arrestin domain-containing protein 3-like [Rhizophagus clarus]
MKELINNVPSKSDYKIRSDKIKFSYSGNQNHFQTGHYGIDTDVSIAGTLHIRFSSSEPLLATKIEIILKGYEKVEWTESYGKRSVTYRAKDVFLNQQFDLWKTSNLNGNYEQIQNMDIPFEINLPENLPPSIKIDGGEGKINYELIANINRKRNLWKFKGSEKWVILSINLDKYFPSPTDLKPFNWYQFNDSQTISRGLGYNITLENSIGGPNMPFIINSLLKFHKQDFKITKIFFGIKEYHKLTTKGKISKKSSFYIVEKNIKRDEIYLNSNDEVKLQVKLEIPEWNEKNKKNPCWTINDRKHIIVNHKIKIKIHCGGMFTNNIKLENEVEIKNIKLENHG